jgi:hypothetical protein
MENVRRNHIPSDLGTIDVTTPLIPLTTPDIVERLLRHMTGISLV